MYRNYLCRCYHQSKLCFYIALHKRVLNFILCLTGCYICYQRGEIRLPSMNYIFWQFNKINSIGIHVISLIICSLLVIEAALLNHVKRLKLVNCHCKFNNLLIISFFLSFLCIEMNQMFVLYVNRNSLTRDTFQRNNNFSAYWCTV